MYRSRPSTNRSSTVAVERQLAAPRCDDRAPRWSARQDRRGIACRRIAARHSADVAGHTGPSSLAAAPRSSAVKPSSVDRDAADLAAEQRDRLGVRVAPVDAPSAAPARRPIGRARDRRRSVRRAQSARDLARVAARGQGCASPPPASCPGVGSNAHAIARRPRSSWLVRPMPAPSAARAASTRRCWSVRHRRCSSLNPRALRSAGPTAPRRRGRSRD